MSISYRNMYAFIQVADSSTFAEAADKLHITQPALSIAIKKMESQLGGALFSRSTRRVQLTPEGRTLLPNARRLINEWDDTVLDMRNLFAMKKGTLSIAAMPSFAASRLPDILKQFHNKQPNVRIRVLDVVMENVIEMVVAGKVELGFTFEPEICDGLCFQPLFNDSFIVVVHSHHPLAHFKSGVEWKNVCQSDFIAMNRGSSLRKWIDEIAIDHGALNIVAETGQLGTIGQLIKQQMGISIVPSLCHEQMENIGLVCLPLFNAPLQKNVGMIRSLRGSMSVASITLWEQCLKSTLQ
ncbi:LysR family transcriptional regulator [Alteromonas sp. ASW11-130]|uniref:LysR family transcriptional regulator n=1 Tax=Alteromonas sp. ASW11-130 TaxID=3015775 RepID=UPI002241972E|nr:LysR family transcriptional regulator [Alteromonas sp. ASW11-130]MCW8092242.1 LysR family transcriptional regulator [Alteromonas sp. ASW11-130]